MQIKTKNKTLIKLIKKINKGLFKLFELKIRLKNFFHSQKTKELVYTSIYKKKLKTGKLIVFNKFAGGLIKHSYKVHKHTGVVENEKLFIFKKDISFLLKKTKQII